MSEVKATKPIHLGPSRDWRTSRWEVVCPGCGARNYPATTMRAVQIVTCEKCGSEMRANYNDGVVTLVGDR